METIETATYGKRILAHYFQLLARRTGQPLDSECIAEIEAAVDDIVQATIDEAIDQVDAWMEREVK